MVIDVIAAFIVKDTRFLICQRPNNKKCPLQWEFVGGKVEKGESFQQCIIREIKEELDVKIEAYQQLCDVEHHYDDFSIHLYLYECSISAGEIKLLEHVDSKWVNFNEVDNYDLAAADKRLVEILRSKYGY